MQDGWPGDPLPEHSQEDWGPCVPARAGQTHLSGRMLHGLGGEGLCRSLEADGAKHWPQHPPTLCELPRLGCPTGGRQIFQSLDWKRGGAGSVPHGPPLSLRGELQPLHPGISTEAGRALDLLLRDANSCQQAPVPTVPCGMPGQ